MRAGTFIEINYKALENNINIIKKIAKNKQILGVVKANAYGHGDTQIAHALEKLGVSYLGVARVSEAVRLRSNGINTNILVLGGAEEYEFEELIKFDLIPVVYSHEMALKLNRYLEFRNISIPVHIKFDTGMHRLGLKVDELAIFKNLKFLKIIGIMSHFLDAGIKDSSWSQKQILLFKELLKKWKELYISLPEYVHMENTAGFSCFNLPETNMVRVGIGMYGYGLTGLKPVFSLFSKLKDIKSIKAGETVCYGGWYKAPIDTNIGIIPVGYGDGFMCSSRTGSVIIGKNKFPIIGVISMDHFIVDLLNNSGVNIGDKVSIIDQELSANYWAKICNTNVYEILTIINPRIERLYS